MASTKKIAVPRPETTAPPDEEVTASQEAHAANVKNAQSKARSAARMTAVSRKPASAVPMAPDSPLATLIASPGTAVAPDAVLEAVDGAIRRGLATPRAIVPKADPAAVAAFFTSTGLTVKQIAAAVGVSTSVISTVTRENGDRWSVARFEAAKPPILAAAKDIAGNTK